MAYSMDALTNDCYEGTTCLINKLDIHDEKALAEVEAAVVLGKASYLEQHPLNGSFDFEHYRAIHRYLFCDLYDWAGQVRTVDMSKKGTAFVPADEIEQCAEACFARLSAFSGQGLTRHELAVEIADYYSTVNMLHPFREGNGRCQRLFFAQWLRCLGFEFDLTAVDADEFMFATIFAAQGVMDSLTNLFEEILRPIL